MSALEFAREIERASRRIVERRRAAREANPDWMVRPLDRRAALAALAGSPR